MATQREKLASITQWDALLARYPQGSPAGLLYQLAVVLAANGMTLRLLVTGRMRPAELVVLVALEAVLLSAIAWLQIQRVPASARLDDEKTPILARLGTLAFGLFWLAVVYGFALGDSFEKLVQDDGWPSAAAFLQSGMQWPLALCLLGAFIDAFRDWEHWCDRGGHFISTPGFNAVARWLTLYLGGIPFLVPMAVVAKLIVTLFERPGQRRAGGSPNPLMILLLLGGVFGLMLWLLNSGISGWAVGFCSAKVVSEVFLICMPLIATKARAEEAEGLGRAKKVT